MRFEDWEALPNKTIAAIQKKFEKDIKATLRESIDEMLIRAEPSWKASNIQLLEWAKTLMDGAFSQIEVDGSNVFVNTNLLGDAFDEEFVVSLPLESVVKETLEYLECLYGDGDPEDEDTATAKREANLICNALRNAANKIESKILPTRKRI